MGSDLKKTKAELVDELEATRSALDHAQRGSPFQTELSSDQFTAALYEITADPDLEYRERIRALLETGTRALGLEVGLITEVTEVGAKVIDAFTLGVESPIARVIDVDCSLCTATLDADDPVAFVQNSEGPPYTHCYSPDRPLTAYIGFRITIAGRPFGALSFMAFTRERRRFSNREKTNVKLLAQWLGHELASHLNQETLEERDRLLQRLIRARDSHQLGTLPQRRPP